jgi:hypothetical protein
VTRQFNYNYYTVHVPGDLYDPDTELKDLAERAIEEAKERAKLVCWPCIWWTKHVRGQPGDEVVTFVVVRRRNKPQRVKA